MTQRFINKISLVTIFIFLACTRQPQTTTSPKKDSNGETKSPTAQESKYQEGSQKKESGSSEKNSGTSPNNDVNSNLNNQQNQQYPSPTQPKENANSPIVKPNEPARINGPKLRVNSNDIAIKWDGRSDLILENIKVN